jgi:outer membrane scaffolding protein for murein synthesis (MipA/OmpV family)
LVGIALLQAAASAWAWGSLLLIEAPPAQTSIAVGPSAWSLPRFPGAHASRQMLLPGVDIYRADGIFASTDTGLGWNLLSRPEWQAGVRLWPQFGRSRADVPAGIATVGHRLQAEVFVNHLVLPVVLLQSGWLHGAGRDHDGTQVELGATSALPIGGQLLGIGLATTWANRGFRQSYFGVASAEAQASGLPAATLGAGWQDASLTLSAEHRWGPQWRLSGQIVRAKLLGAAARSPLTRSPMQTAATLTLWRDF